MASYNYTFTITGGIAQASSGVPKAEPTFTSNSAKYLGCTSYNNVNYGTQYCVNLYNSSLASLVNETASSIVITLNFNALPYLQYFMVGRKLASGTGNYTYARMFRVGPIAKSATSCTIDVTSFGICPYGYIIYVGDGNGTNSYTTVNSASIAITTEAAVKTIRVPLVLNAKRCSSTSASDVRSNTLAKYTTNNEPERYIGSANSYQRGYAIQALWPAAGSNGYPSGYTLSSLLQSTAAAGFSSLKLKIYHFSAGYKLGLYYGLLKGTSGSAELASTGTQLEIAKPSDAKATTCTEITLNTSTRNSYGYGIGGNISGSYAAAYTNVVGMVVEGVVANYTVSYANGGHGTAPSSQTKTYGQALTLQPFIATNYSSESTVTITGNANGGSWSGSNGSAKWRYKYTQSNWKATNGTTYSSGGSYTANAATTMTATWSEAKEGTSYTLPTGTPTKGATTTNSLTVSYNANGGNSTPNSQTSSKPVTYSFKGWFTAASGGTQRTTKSRVTAAETIYAQYNSTTGSQSAITLAAAISKTSGTSSDSYTLTRSTSGITITGGSNGTCVKTATTPYTFNGWHEGSAGGTSHGAGTSFTPSASITMYAGWNTGTTTYSYSTTVPTATSVTKASDVNTRTISYNINTGTSTTPSDQNSTQTTTYTWDGKWWTAASGGNQITTSSTFDAATTVYPHFTSSTGNWTSITLPSASKTGYTFAGWYTDSSGGTYIGMNGDSYTPDQSRTLYAQWTQNGYAVTYNANGHGTAPAGQTKLYGNDLTLRPFISDVDGTTNTVTITGNANGGTWSGNNGSATWKPVYSQTYWNTQSNGSGTNYESEATYSDNAALALYAIWSTTNVGLTYTIPSGTPTKADTTSNVYTISYNGHGSSSTPSSQTSQKTTTYSFKGWYTASSGGTQRTNNSRVTAAETVYAQYNSSTGAQSTITLPTVTRSGYGFLGWYTAETGGTRVGGAGDSYTPDATRTLHAQWSQNTFTVSYNKGSSGFGTNTSDEKAYGVTLTLRSAIFTRPGYSQKGWATSDGGPKAYELNGSYTTNAAITLYPYWEIASIIHIDVGGMVINGTVYVKDGNSMKLGIVYVKDNGSIKSTV